MPPGLGTPSRMSIVVRAPRDEAGAVAGLRRAVATLDPQLPLQRVRTMDTVLDGALALALGASPARVRRWSRRS